MRDERIKKTLVTEDRATRHESDVSRAPPEDTMVSSEERLRAWKDDWTQEALPKLPELKGWHLCWLSSTNVYDSIDKRIRLGYQPVRADECPGYEQFRIKAGEHVGYIACNEMLLFKLPMDVYQEVMTHFHHDLPMDEAGKVRTSMESSLNMRDRNGRPLAQIEGTGIADLTESTRAPTFSG